MNKSELVSYIAAKYKTTKIDGEQFINKFIEIIEDVLSKGDSINLVGFGNWKVKKTPAKQGRNPKTGEAIHIKSYNRPIFKAGKNLKNKVNLLID